jgi:hypothetical protein
MGRRAVGYRSFLRPKDVAIMISRKKSEGDDNRMTGLCQSCPKIASRQTLGSQSRSRSSESNAQRPQRLRIKVQCLTQSGKLPAENHDESLSDAEVEDRHYSSHGLQATRILERNC